MDTTAERRARFSQFKRNYDIYGTHTTMDPYMNEQLVKDETARGSIYVMWFPSNDSASIVQYGRDVTRMLYALVYDDTQIKYGDRVTIYGEDFEVVGIKMYNNYRRVEVRRLKTNEQLTEENQSDGGDGNG